MKKWKKKEINNICEFQRFLRENKISPFHSVQKHHAREDMNRMTKCAEWQSFNFFFDFHASAKLSSCHAVDRRTSQSSRVSEQCMSACRYTIARLTVPELQMQFGGGWIVIIRWLHRALCQQSYSPLYFIELLISNPLVLNGRCDQYMPMSIWISTLYISFLD